VITAAADGSSLSNPGPAGWAWYIDDATWAAGGWPHGTNNMGELMAVLDLLRQTSVVADEPLSLLCDSQYVINSLTKWMPAWKARGWRKADGKPVLNRELLAELDDAMSGRDLRFTWVKGHAGQRMNEAADVRARAAATAYQQGTPVPSGPGFPGSRVASASLDVAPAPAPAPEPDLFSVPVSAGTPRGARPWREAPASEPEPDDLARVSELQRMLVGELGRRSAVRLRELLHSDYVEYRADGHIFTRARLLAATASPDLAAPDVSFEPLGTDRLGTDVVLVRWRSRAGLHSCLWVREDGRWLARFAQGTPTV